MNNVSLVGRVARDIEVRSTRSGKPVGDFVLAVNQRQKNEHGEWVDTPTFIDVTCWGRHAELVAEYLPKGAAVGVVGRIDSDSWTTKEGQKRTKLKVTASDIHFLPESGRKPPAQRATSPSDPMSGETLPEVDAPF